MTTTTQPRTFTDQTWKALGPSGLTRDTGRDLGWMRRHDLGVELAEKSGLEFELARDLVSAVASGLPVTLTWEIVRASGCGQDDVARTTATVIVEQVGGPNPNVYTVHVRYWGFAHPITLGQLQDVQVPEAVYGFEYRDQGAAA